MKTKLYECKDCGQICSAKRIVCHPCKTGTDAMYEYIEHIKSRLRIVQTKEWRDV